MRVQIAVGKAIEVDATKTFGQSARRYKWYDHKDTKWGAQRTAKRLRTYGALARIVQENTGGYNIYLFFGPPKSAATRGGSSR